MCSMNYSGHEFFPFAAMCRSAREFAALGVIGLAADHDDPDTLSTAQQSADASLLCPMRTTLAIVCILARLVVALGPPTQRTFRVQHDFGLGEDQKISWAASASLPLTEDPSLTIKTHSTRLSRPVSVDLVQQARHASMHDGLSMALEWTEVVTSGPDIEDRHTLSQVCST
jgi:hypothetical protein